MKSEVPSDCSALHQTVRRIISWRSRRSSEQLMLYRTSRERQKVAPSLAFTHLLDANRCHPENALVNPTQATQL
jgi:hypothetical protein